jgi:hypothetical protein
MDEHPHYDLAHPAPAGRDGNLNQGVPVYLEYPPAGWPDAFPPRRPGFDLLRWPVLRRFALIATFQIVPVAVAG